MKKVLIVLLSIIFAHFFMAAVLAETPQAKRPGFIMLLGTVSNIDKTNPSNIKIEVKDSRDNQIHAVEITPATNITKVTDISELKTGDPVRIMVRKVDKKETAMGIMFGNLKIQQASPQLKAASKK